MKTSRTPSRAKGHSSVQSEITELEKIIQDIPEDNMIDRYIFEERLTRVRKELEALDTADSGAESLRLTFRGAPVVGNRGIYADFASKASSAFSDAFSAIMAGLNSKLNYMGPIPDRAKHPLMITGTATGSFGFEIELPTDNGLFLDYSGSDMAIEIFQDLMRVSAEGSDDDIAEIVQDIHPRAARKVADFLQVLHENKAMCGLEFREDFFKFADLDQIQESVIRLREGNIDERLDAVTGEFQGILPQGRTFEFRCSEDLTIIRGKIHKSFDDPDLLNREWLHRHVEATFSVVQVGNGRPRYTLTSIESLKPI